MCKSTTGTHAPAQCIWLLLQEVRCKKKKKDFVSFPPGCDGNTCLMRSLAVRGSWSSFAASFSLFLPIIWMFCSITGSVWTLTVFLDALSQLIWIKTTKRLTHESAGTSLGPLKCPLKYPWAWIRKPQLSPMRSSICADEWLTFHYIDIWSRADTYVGECSLKI